MVIFFWGASLFVTIRRPPDDAHQRRRRRQAVDVEAPAPGRPARDQRAARPGRPAGQAHDDVRGRDPQLLRPGVPHQAGRGARALHDASWFEATKPGELPPLLRRVLRHAALGHDRARRRDGAGRVPGLARRAAAGRGGRAASPAARARALFQAQGCVHVPSRPTAAARAARSPGVFGKHGHARGRRHRRRRRELPARVDPRPAGEARRRASSRHADLPGPAQRGGRHAAHRVHQVARRARRGRHDGAERRSRRARRPTPAASTT